MDLPSIPAPLEDFIPYFTNAPGRDLGRLQPYLDYEAKLRQIYAQEPDNLLLQDDNVNTVPVYAGHTDSVKIRARDLDAESQAEREHYLLPLPAKGKGPAATVPAKARKESGSAAVVPTKRDFETNFDIFTESSLRYLDWNNVVAAGSSVVTSLLPLDHPQNESRRAQREYYNQKLAPASDVDLFIHGLDEESAFKKLAQIEANIRDAVLCETTVVRTKYAVTIVSQYPVRHIQIVLRLYKSISEILTGFDVDCACVAYDGSQVWATPRAMVAYMTQTNIVDLSRRSPSYENRLSKYSHRGFEVYWPSLDRSRIDPTIFERSFGSVTGLARLLVFEALPTPEDRDQYRNVRREERGRPEIPSYAQKRRNQLPGNAKDEQPDDVPDWIDEEDVSNYHTFTLPYGPRYHAKKIEKLLFGKDILLNSEWNRPKDRKVNLHRHPAFFGYMKDVLEDCCGFCPPATTEEEIKLAEEEAKIYISGNAQFLTDNPGRQEIGSFHPLDSDGWTEMAYVSNAQRFLEAIVDGNLEQVEQHCKRPGFDVNGRDHTGRTPLHLAAMCSTPEVVQCLLDNGARIIARVADGLTAFHIAVRRGDVRIVQAMIDRSLKNAAEEDEKKAAKSHAKDASTAEADQDAGSVVSDDSDVVMLDDQASENSDHSDTLTQGSFVKLSEVPDPTQVQEEDGDSGEPDIIDPNAPAWDYLTAPLHLAIMGGHIEIVRLLVDSLNADTMLPVVFRRDFDSAIDRMVLTLVLAARYSPDPMQMVKELHEMGVPFSQADIKENTVAHHIVNDENLDMLNIFRSLDPQDVKRALCHFYIDGVYSATGLMSSLMTGIRHCNTEIALKILEIGAPPTVTFDGYRRAHHRFVRSMIKNQGATMGVERSNQELRVEWAINIEQPIIEAILNDLPHVVRRLLDMGADPNEVTGNGKITTSGYFRTETNTKESVLDLVRSRINALKREIEIYPRDPDIFGTLGRLEEDDFYLQRFEPGSYQYLVARSNLLVAKAVSAAMWKEFEKLKPIEKHFERKGNGAVQKKDAMKSALEAFQELETYLLSRNAKTFEELYPDRVESREPPERDHIQKSRTKDTPFYQTEFHFEGTDPDKAVQRGYILLFEAAWEGNTESLKALTMGKWSLDEDLKLSQDGSAASEKYEPLVIAVEDGGGYSPFSIAILRGHFELARLVLEIAEAQYLPSGEKHRRQYALGGSDDSDSDAYSESESGSDDDSSERVKIKSRAIQDPVTSTVEELDGLANRISSRTSPLAMFNWKIRAWHLFDSVEEAERAGFEGIPENRYRDGYVDKLFGREHFEMLINDTKYRGRVPLSKYAVKRNDSQLFTLLIQLGEELVARERRRGGGTERVATWYLPDYSLGEAAKYGRIEMMEQVIGATAAKLPLSKLAEKYGVRDTVAEKPKYYQGLTVRGKKRKGWVAADHSLSEDGDEEGSYSYLLTELVYSHNVDTIKWCLSGAPLKVYMAYIESHQDDKRIQELQKAPGGIQPVIENWLQDSPYLAVHAAAGMHGDEDEIYPVLAHLLTQMPQTVNSVDKSRRPLLYNACCQPSLKRIKLLIDNGADPFKRGPQSRNILHMALANTGFGDRWWKAQSLAELFKLLGPDAVEKLLGQRSSATGGLRTPLLTLLHAESSDFEEIMDVILSYSKGRDLETMDGKGEYPLHFAVREGLTRMARVILEFNPSLLYFENAVGLTPFDLASNKHLRQQLQPGRNRGDEDQYSLPVDFPTFSDRRTIPERKEREFIPADVLRERREKKDSVENTWRLCQEVALAHPQRRKLVSLHDASEVVKRLVK
ncbi:hypothetical protein FQN54_004544 [Arachnomyces sp. PD_36]|nr:hypothetical protein FQN54_004544 [Arachnomyces sp. PD_36]